MPEPARRAVMAVRGHDYIVHLQVYFSCTVMRAANDEKDTNNSKNRSRKPMRYTYLVGRGFARVLRLRAGTRGDR